MNTTTAARFGATNRRPAQARGVQTGVRWRTARADCRSVSWSCAAPRRRHGTAGLPAMSPAGTRAAPARSCGPSGRRSFPSAGVIGRPSELAGPAGQHREIADPAVGLGESGRSDRGSQHRDEQAGFTDQRLPDGAGRRISRIPTPAPCVDCSPRWPVRWCRYWSGRSCPRSDPTGSTVTSKSRPSARSKVWYRQCPPSAIAALPTANRSMRGHRLLLGCGGRNLVLVGQVGVELHAFDERVVIEVEVCRVHPRIGPRRAVVHGEQPGRVGRQPRCRRIPIGRPVPIGPAW